MKSNGKLCPLGKLVVKALRERVGELAEMFDGNFAVKQYRKEARS